MDDEAVVDWKGLKEQFGWPYSRTQTWRMMAEGRFPRAFKLGEHRNSHPVWKRREIVEHLQPR
jgi:predicted DNA-binding transcriptional regulator AlpA